MKNCGQCSCVFGPMRTPQEVAMLKSVLQTGYEMGESSLPFFSFQRVALFASGHERWLRLKSTPALNRFKWPVASLSWLDSFKVFLAFCSLPLSILSYKSMDIQVQRMRPLGKPSAFSWREKEVVPLF